MRSSLPLACAAALLLATGCGLVSAGETPLIVAHRMGADLFPENSRRAIAGSIERGWEAIEIDLVLTRDGVPVIWHDPWIESKLCRRIGGEEIPEGERILFQDLTLAELHAGFECGGKPHPDGKHPDVELAWDTHATFDELLTALRAAPEMVVQLDVKYEPGFTADAETFAREILGRWRAAALPNRMYASATHPELLRAFEAALPGIETTLIWPRFSKAIDERSDITVAVGNELSVVAGVQDLGARILDANADGIAIAWQVSNRQTIQRLRDEGFNVQLWTVASPGRLGAYCDWPVDALITDNPEEAPCR